MRKDVLGDFDGIEVIEICTSRPLKFSKRKRKKRNKQAKRDLKQFRLNKKFNNYYLSNSVDAHEIQYTIFEGFSSVDEAKAFVAKYSYPEFAENFVYLRFMGMFYPVSMENLPEQIVISKQYIKYRSSYREEFVKTNKKNVLRALNTISLEKPRSSGRWNDQIVNHLRKVTKHCIDVAYIGSNAKQTYVKYNAPMLLAQLFFDTDIPVYKLNVVDSFFNSCPPSRWKLWQKYDEYNPFRGEQYNSRFLHHRKMKQLHKKKSGK